MINIKNIDLPFNKSNKLAKETSTLLNVQSLKMTLKDYGKLSNNIMKDTNNKSCIINSTEIDNIVHFDAADTSCELGKFFSTVGKRVATKGRNSNIPIANFINKISREPKSIFLTPCNKSESKSLINKLPSKISSGYDDTSNVLLKELGDEILDSLMKIFNMSLQMGIFPTDMKIADVSPLFNNGSRKLLNNY